jgi:hypothetical protein
MPRQPLVAHTKQFVIGPEFVRVRDDWRSYPVTQGVMLSADPALHILELFSAVDVRHLLFGHAVLLGQLR